MDALSWRPLGMRRPILYQPEWTSANGTYCFKAFGLLLIIAYYSSQINVRQHDFVCITLRRHRLLLVHDAERIGYGLQYSEEKGARGEGRRCVRLVGSCVFDLFGFCPGATYKQDGTAPKHTFCVSFNNWRC